MNDVPVSKALRCYGVSELQIKNLRRRVSFRDVERVGYNPFKKHLIFHMKKGGVIIICYDMLRQTVNGMIHSQSY